MVDPNEDDFWSSRASLEHVRRSARARRAGPWAVLGVVLARAIAAVEPNVQLPPIIGGATSLNMFTALVGPSGGGKGAAEAAARDALRFVDCSGAEIATESFTLGSGEGLARTFRPNGMGDDTERRTRALFSVAEVDTLGALGSRTGATLMPELRKLYSGESIGFQNAGKTTRLVVGAHEYRACLTVGVQPAKAGALISDAEGGTPQRFLWLPVGDPDAPDVKPDEPLPLRVTMPRWGASLVLLDVPDAAKAEMDAHRVAVLKGRAANPLDGHTMLTRLKVAAALMILDGRSIVSSEDWDLAGMLMRKSDRTRAGITVTLREKGRRANRERAEKDAERAVIVEDAKQRGELDRVRRTVINRLEKESDGMTRGDLNRALKVDIRCHLDSVLADLASEGVVDPRPKARGGQVYVLL
ncbi:hypothetical protein GS502_13530 [Rhodococcus hoagii]|nr:hypothetical protein [Prescottella equi]